MHTHRTPRTPHLHSLCVLGALCLFGPTPALADGGPPPLQKTPSSTTQRPAPLKQSVKSAQPNTKTWPFVRWDRAEALRFNPMENQPGVPRHAFGAQGLSPYIIQRQELSPALTHAALQRVRDSQGEYESSSCGFPRYAIVLWHQDEPVASVNLDLDCGDLLLWPRWDTKKVPYNQKIMRRYDTQLLPAWQQLFTEQLTWEQLPQLEIPPPPNLHNPHLTIRPPHLSPRRTAPDSARPSAPLPAQPPSAPLPAQPPSAP